MTPFRAAFAFILLLAFAGRAAAQDRIAVEFSSRPGDPASVGAVTRGGHVYASLNDVVAVFGLRSYENPGSEKLEIKSGIFAVKVTANNPYVVVRDENRFLCHA